MLYYPAHISPRIPVQSSVFTVHKQPDNELQPPEGDMVIIELACSPLTMKFDLNFKKSIAVLMMFLR